MDIKNELNSINKIAQKEYDNYYSKIISTKSIVEQEKKFIKMKGLKENYSKKSLSELTENNLKDLTEIIYYLSIGLIFSIFSIYVMISPYIPLSAMIITAVGVIFLLLLICGWLYLLFSSINIINVLENKIIMFFIKRKKRKNNWDFTNLIQYYFEEEFKKHTASGNLSKLINCSKLFNNQDKKYLIKANGIELIKIINITSDIKSYEYFKSEHKIRENFVVQKDDI